MNTLHDHPSLPIDPDRVFVSLKLADAQRIAKHLEGMTLAKHHEGIPLDEVIDMYAPVVEGIRAALNKGQETAVQALGLSAIKAEDARRGKQICDKDDRLMAEERKSPNDLIKEAIGGDGRRMMDEMAAQVRARETGAKRPAAELANEGHVSPEVHHYVDGKSVTQEEQAAVVRARERANRGIKEKDGAGKRNTG